MDLEVSAEELARRLAQWQPRAPCYATGVFGKYCATVQSASQGAITTPGKNP